MTTKLLVMLALFYFLLNPAHAQNCSHEKSDSKPDAESVARVEKEWTKAFLSGDTDYLECLLEPDYQSVSYTGEVRSRQDIIDKARAHRAKPIPMPTLPAPTLQIHGDTAISRSDIDIPDPAVKQPRKVRFLDVFSFYDGRWHAVYTQDVELKLQ
ncbi:MAG: nuclear transport factor 2 family protein [Candidatus Acidiferrales bacterium]